MKWLNTDIYSWLELGLVLVSTIGWVGTYMSVIRHEKKYGFVEMPFFIACGNLVWEFLYSWTYAQHINLGLLFVWGTRAWFFLDVYIFWLMLKDNGNDIQTPIIRKYYRPILAILLVIWFCIIYAIAETGLDNIPFMSMAQPIGRLGGFSAYILNFGISMLYIIQYLQRYEQLPFSKATAWLKWFGTACVTVFFFLADPHNTVLLTLASLVFVLDISYIVLMYILPQSPTLRQSPAGTVTA